ncbi:hypothetical protein ACSBR2_006447 [Camellia fascicularis]
MKLTTNCRSADLFAIPFISMSFLRHLSFYTWRSLLCSTHLSQLSSEHSPLCRRPSPPKYTFNYAGLIPCKEIRRQPAGATISFCVRVKKGPWTPEEDQKLLAFIEEYGHGSWRALPQKQRETYAGLQRCGKSCRLRWTNYLRPDIKRGKFSLQEEQTIIQLHALLGNR